ncbi:uncharacterized protein LOC113371013 [Ctenocephalides felis]|uniref:uncharacterized protein LOC113371013 n=1 Tax=Ctenocephalides felis TaxID=7515 RepID=UPI000E6E5B04|nr:uncharacterized protein LOC113371013 [Ctenocephalides felis]
MPCSLIVKLQQTVSVDTTFGKRKHLIKTLYAQSLLSDSISFGAGLYNISDCCQLPLVVNYKGSEETLRRPQGSQLSQSSSNPDPWRRCDVSPDQSRPDEAAKSSSANGRIMTVAFPISKARGRMKTKPPRIVMLTIAKMTT